MEKYAEALWQFYSGRFGRYHLRNPYMRYWRIFWIVVHVWLFVRYILFSFFGLWDFVVSFFNQLVWG